MDRSRLLPLVIAIVGVIAALATVASVVPRIQLVEAITLFATAFGAGAAFVAALVGFRRQNTTR